MSILQTILKLAVLTALLVPLYYDDIHAHANDNTQGAETKGTQNSSQRTSTQMIRGGVGLLQTPTARMAEEGNFTVNYSDVNEYRFWTASIQLLPWMESTVRYSDVRTQLYSPFPGFSGDQTLKDKGIDVKFRLMQESFYLPEVALGFQDIGGTGLFSGEFISLSKAFGPLDFHLGLGTGYLGAGANISNPFCQIKDSFCERPGGFSGNGGKVEFGEFFKGSSSLFGGIEYRTPLDGLILKLEYEGNDYSQDRAGVLAQDSKWNMGAVYRYKDWDFGVSYQRGNTFGFNLSYNFNFDTLDQVKIDRAPRNIVNATPAESMETLDRSRLYNDLSNEASFLLSATYQKDNEIYLYGTQLAYRDHDEATERIGRILASELPESIETYKIVETIAHTPMVETEIDANEFKIAARYERLETDISESYERKNPSEKAHDNYRPNSLSGWLLNIDSFYIQTFGNPEDFYLYQGGAFVNTGYAFNANFSVRGGIKVTLLDNFDKFNFFVDGQESALPRVRTFVREYVTNGNVGLENLYLHWFDKLAEDTYFQVYGGYLETMFGGVGTEILYRPVDSTCLLYTSPSPRDRTRSRMPSSD